jgi:ABC-type branched-subunit amino acid transport system ATPase component
MAPKPHASRDDDFRQVNFRQGRARCFGVRLHPSPTNVQAKFAMYESITVRGFRQFRTFDLPSLTRVNLFVGRNNAGKSSLLESIEILAMGGRPAALLRSPRRRGELSSEVPEERAARTELDLRHLFFGHKLQQGSSFALEGLSDGERKAVVCEIQTSATDEGQLTLLPDADLETRLAVSIRGPENAEGSMLPLSVNGTVVSDVLRRFPLAAANGSAAPVVFLGTEGADAFALQQIWDNLVLTPEEDKVTAAMKIIEPSIERLAFTSREIRSQSTAFLKLAGEDQRVPLGSLGDGTRRLLALAIFLARASGGVLLVDEIDTGLHYTTLEAMWRFVVETARRLSVQVFATSHSGDCVRALAWLQAESPELAAEISVHRVEKGTNTAVAYSSNDIETAARHHIEVRG